MQQLLSRDFTLTIPQVFPFLVDLEGEEVSEESHGGFDAVSGA